MSSMSLSGTGRNLPSRSEAIWSAWPRMACQSATQTPTSSRTARTSDSSALRKAGSATRWSSMCIQLSVTTPSSSGAACAPSAGAAGTSTISPAASRRTGTIGWTNTAMSMPCLVNSPVRESTRNGESLQTMSRRVLAAASGPSASAGQCSSRHTSPGARRCASSRWRAVVSNSCRALRPTRSSSATRLQYRSTSLASEPSAPARPAASASSSSLSGRVSRNSSSPMNANTSRLQLESTRPTSL